MNTEISHVDAATQAIAGPIVAATNMANRAALSLAATITSVIEEVDVRGIDVLAGAGQLPLVAMALLKQTEAREAALVARVALFKEGRRLGVTAYGPDCACAPSASPAPISLPDGLTQAA